MSFQGESQTYFGYCAKELWFLLILSFMFIWNVFIYLWHINLKYVNNIRNKIFIKKRVYQNQDEGFVQYGINVKGVGLKLKKLTLIFGYYCGHDKPPLIGKNIDRE